MNDTVDPSQSMTPYVSSPPNIRQTSKSLNEPDEIKWYNPITWSYSIWGLILGILAVLGLGFLIYKLM